MYEITIKLDEVISTNRYKELLQIEKYYHKLQKEDSELIEEYKDRIDKLYDEIGILEEKIINAIEYIENNDYVEYRTVISMLRGDG